MCLGVSTSAAKDIGHSGLGVREMVFINFKLIPQLKLLIIKCRVSSVYKQRGVHDLYRAQQCYALS